MNTLSSPYFKTGAEIIINRLVNWPMDGKYRNAKPVFRIYLLIVIFCNVCNIVTVILPNFTPLGPEPSA